MRPEFYWKLRSRSLHLGKRTLIMGVVNVTPDSFSDGGKFLDSGSAVEHALQLLAEGADILDLGGESTRPGAKATVSSAEEQRRILPVLTEVLRRAPETIISIDTYKADTARAALDEGAEIINDVSGFTWDPSMLRLMAAETCGCVLMHTRGRPEEWHSLPALAADEVVPLVLTQLRHLSDTALSAGVAPSRIVLDPGFGFGKRMNENFPLLANFHLLQELGFPLLSGMSRKSFLARTSAEDRSDAARLSGSLAALTASILQGAHIVRVHDVKESVAAARVADEVLSSAALPQSAQL
jgi:dihydropteroate synthase